MRVMKFGGTSVGTPDRIRDLVRLVRASGDPNEILVVVSAFGGVTNALIDAAKKAGAGDPAWRDDLDGIAKRHFDAATSLAPAAERVCQEP